MFCAPSRIWVSDRISETDLSDVNGGHTATSRSRTWPTEILSLRTRARASPTVLNIFQLPARSFFLRMRTNGRGYRSSRAATPGRIWPSRNSIDAPPPVEMWSILSATPAPWTADTQSPPPTTLVAPDDASARAKENGPSAYSGRSNLTRGTVQ